MLQFFAKRLKQLHEVKGDERGFTLIELIVVVYGSFTILLAAPYVGGVVALLSVLRALTGQGSTLLSWLPPSH